MTGNSFARFLYCPKYSTENAARNQPCQKSARHELSLLTSFSNSKIQSYSISHRINNYANQTGASTHFANLEAKEAQEAKSPQHLHRQLCRQHLWNVRVSFIMLGISALSRAQEATPACVGSVGGSLTAAPVSAYCFSGFPGQERKDCLSVLPHMQTQEEEEERILRASPSPADDVLSQESSMMLIFL